MRVLVSGAAGRLGQVLTTGLRDRGYDVTGLDLLPEPEGFDGAWITADCADPDAVSAVVAGSRPDAVVHLAGRSGEGNLAESLTSHAVTTGALLDAMVEHDVRRILYASSNHAVGRTPRSDLLTVDVPPRPDTFYGVAKVAAEALLQLCADRDGIDAIACRIGSCLPQPETVRHLSTWLSHDDWVRLADAALMTPAPGFAVLYGISANTRAWWDLGPGHAVGYHPADNAEDFADSIPARLEDDAEAAYVGGPFTGEAFRRPSLDRG